MDDIRLQRMIDEANRYIKSLDPEEIERRNSVQNDENKRDYQALNDALAHGQCVYCGYPITHFSEEKPCFHWLLNPKGFKKRHFPLLFERLSFHRLEAYLRWVATCEHHLRNVNDLVEERSSSKKIETTMRYKNLEWSLSCSHGDFAGHLDSRYGQMPHYHFQMKVDGRVMINYGAYHIPFHKEDIFGFAVKDGKIEGVEHRNIEGATIQTFLDNIPPEDLFNALQRAEKEDEATFNMQTLVEADEGATIKGSDLAEIFEESKRTGEPIARIMKRKLKNVKQQTVILPGPGLPGLAKRTPRQR